MATDVFPVVGSIDETTRTQRTTMSGWLVVFCGAMAFALVFASLQLVWPPDEARLDPAITVQ